MRLNNYLNENRLHVDQLDQLIDTIKKDCGPFLSQVKGKVTYPLVRSGKPFVREIKLIRKVARTDRKAKHTKQETSDFYDELFFKKFGWKPRKEGVFCWGRERQWVNSIESFFMFPIGDFKFIWSPKISDLYAALPLSFKGASLPEVVTHVMSEYTDKNLAAAINSEFEISIKCKEYYLLAVRNNKDIFYVWEQLYK